MSEERQRLAALHRTRSSRVRGWAVCACWALFVTRAGAAPVRNVILFVGDGMGLGQIEAARCYAGETLFFESFPFRSLIDTAAAGGWITDSAASGTALATGYKVNNGVVSLAIPGDEQELETVLEYFQGWGKASGLVTTSYLTDATPAVFGAHAAYRFDSEMIAWQYLNRTRPEVLMGGEAAGLSLAVAESAGYHHVVTDRLSLVAAQTGTVARLCGLFGAGYLPYEYDGLGERPSLAEMTACALSVLSRDPDGFFLMVEGGLIDIACHGNDLARCVAETLAFDRAVETCAAWAHGRDDTLILVVADHETGGLSVVRDAGPGLLPEVSWSTTGHTAAPIALFGWGANAEWVEGASDNTHVAGLMRRRVPLPGEAVSITRTSVDRLQAVWAALSGTVYRIEQSAALRPAAWQTREIVTAVTSRVTLEHVVGTEPSCGFFRMVPMAP
ncbi:MAG: alkaline phosphatase [Kiritimatiellia bacterium]|nr:alkaline phosphatase [Kiritimatiellia bacterium]